MRSLKVSFRNCYVIGFEGSSMQPCPVYPKGTQVPCERQKLPTCRGVCSDHNQPTNAALRWMHSNARRMEHIRQEYIKRFVYLTNLASDHN
jgi:hypothetical protein